MDRNTWTRFWTGRGTSSNPNTSISRGQPGIRLQKQVLDHNHVLLKENRMTIQTKKRRRKDKMLRRWNLVQMKM